MLSLLPPVGPINTWFTGTSGFRLPLHTLFLSPKSVFTSPWAPSHWRSRPVGFLPLVCLNLISLLIQQVLQDTQYLVVAFNSMSHQISRAFKSFALHTAAFFLTFPLCRVIISLPPGQSWFMFGSKAVFNCATFILRSSTKGINHLLHLELLS